MGKNKKSVAAVGATSSGILKSKADAKSIRQSLNIVLNIQGLVSDDSRWASDEDEKASLASLEQSLSKLRQQQRAWRCAIPKRGEAAFAAFTEWLTSVGVDMSAAPFRIGWVSGDDALGMDDNATLFATRDISESEGIVTVPSAAMISTKTASTSSVGQFLASVPALRAVPSVVLALHLLAETLDADSRFQPYIQVLPARFTIPYSLPFSADDLLSLRPSPAYERAVKTLRAQVMQYAKVYELLNKAQTGCPALTVENFSYANFEWAISVVMTRQNALPSSANALGGPQTLALVPIWDMCNHAPGPHTTGVILDPATNEASVECCAMRSFSPGEAITIFYGARPNSELLLFSGFIQQNNAHDTLSVSIPFVGEDRRALVAKSVLMRRELGKEASRVTTKNNDATGNVIMTLGDAIKSDGSIDPVLAVLARVAGTDLGSGSMASSVDSESASKSAHSFLLRCFQEKLDEYSEMMGDDSVTQHENSVDGNRAIALSLIHALHGEEQRLLRAAITSLESDGLPLFEETNAPCSCCS